MSFKPVNLHACFAKENKTTISLNHDRPKYTGIFHFTGWFLFCIPLRMFPEHWDVINCRWNPTKTCLALTVVALRFLNVPKPVATRCLRFKVIFKKHLIFIFKSLAFGEDAITTYVYIICHGTSFQSRSECSEPLSYRDR